MPTVTMNPLQAGGAQQQQPDYKDIPIGYVKCIVVQSFYDKIQILKWGFLSWTQWFPSLNSPKFFITYFIFLEVQQIYQNLAVWRESSFCKKE